MKSMKLRTACLVVVSASAVLFGSSAMSQSDSSNVPALRGTPIVPLRLQQRETPVVNNITNTTNQITQVIQPSITTAAGSASGFRFATAWANCGGATLVGGGGSCNADNGYAAMPTSQPNGNSWQVICDAFQGGNVTANSWATCSN